jgi:hypothetical protein
MKSVRFAVCLLAGSLAAAPALAEDPFASAAPLDEAQLEANRGTGDEPLIEALVQNNTANVSGVQGTNAISGSALAGARGVFTTVQNFGNNVAINVVTTVNVTFTD